MENPTSGQITHISETIFKFCKSVNSYLLIMMNVFFYLCYVGESVLDVLWSPCFTLACITQLTPLNREVAESSFSQQLFSPLVFNRAFCAVLKFKTIIRIQISSNWPQCVTPAHFFANQYCGHTPYHKIVFRQWFE